MNIVPAEGAAIEVYWSDDDEYYAAKVGPRQAIGNVIFYDDSEVELLDLSRVQWIYLGESKPVQMKNRKNVPSSGRVRLAKAKPSRTCLTTRTNNPKRKRSATESTSATPDKNQVPPKTAKRRKRQNLQDSARSRLSTTPKVKKQLKENDDLLPCSKPKSKDSKINQNSIAKGHLPAGSQPSRKMRKTERQPPVPGQAPNLASCLGSDTNCSLRQYPVSMCTYVVEGAVRTEEGQSSDQQADYDVPHDEDTIQTEEQDMEDVGNDLQPRHQSADFEAQMSVQRKAHALLLATAWIRNNRQYVSDKEIKDIDTWAEMLTGMCLSFVRENVKNPPQNHELDLGKAARVTDLQNTLSTYKWFEDDVEDDALLDVLFQDDRNPYERNLSVERSFLNSIREKLSKYLECL